jgi:PAS domain S-box-containing protein
MSALNPRAETAVGQHRAARTLCLCGAALGALGLAGSVFDVPVVTTFITGRPAMMPNTAVSLMMIGLAATFRVDAGSGRIRTVLALLLALGALTIGSATLTEYVLGWDLRIDQVLHSMTDSSPYPGRPSPLTAVSLILLAVALLLPVRRWTRFRSAAEWLTIVAASLAFLSLVGHLFGAGQLYEWKAMRSIGVAVPTAAALLLIAFGTLLRNAGTSRMTLATSRGPGGILVRRLGIVAIVGPPVLGAIAYRALHLAGFVDLPLTLAVLTTVGVPVALVVTFVTARYVEHAHEALAASRERTRQLIEESADGFFVADLDGRYTDVNAAGCRMLGYAREQIIGRTIIDLLSPDEVERLVAARSALLAGGTQTAEWHLRKSDGTYLPVEVSAKILPDGRWQGVARDITRRKEAENAARRSEARLEGIISIAADAIISVDEHQRIVMFNEGATRIFGWSKAEALGQPLDLLIPRRFAEAHSGHVQAFDREPVAARMMYGRPVVAGLRKNGEEFPAEGSISRLADGSQRLFSVFLRDVTVQRQLQEELRQSVERFRFLAEAGEIVGSSLDPEQITRTLALLATRSFASYCIIEIADGERALIRTRADAPEGSSEGVASVERAAVHPDEPLGWMTTRRQEPTLVADITDEWLESHALEESTLALIRGLGAKSLIEVPIVADGRFIGGMLLLSASSSHRFDAADLRTVLDLARRTALAAENARLYREARAATQARDEMLSIVAHDLRSPLAAAQTGASLLVHQIPEERRDASRRTAEAIHRAIHRAARLVDDLLDEARIEGGTIGLNLREVAPEVIVRNAVEVGLPLAADASVQLDADVDPALRSVLADEDRIQQALGNLVSNAIKFTPAGARVVIAAQRDGDEIRFSVKDSGPGVAPDNLPRVFDRFWQANSADRRGVGLGLAIAKAIVTAHRGHIQADSVHGEGSTFWFTLPIFDSESGLRPDGDAAGPVSLAPTQRM